jgi:hypothetical protein
VNALPEPLDASDAAKDLEKTRLRIHDTASKLRPLENPDDLTKRVRAVVRELQDIQESLLLYVHCAQLEENDFEGTLEKIDKKLADGWVPESAPVEDVIDRLRLSLTSPS